MLSFAGRNLRLFFRDRTAVFFSLLSVFIVLGLYLLFLGDVWADGMEDIPGVRALMNSWIVAGLLSVASVTTAMGAFGTMITDRCQGIDRDFQTTPMRRSLLTGGYILSAFLVALIMSFVTLFAGQGYLLLQGGSLFSGSQLLRTAGILFLTALSNSAMLLFFVSWFRSTQAFGTASTILGTLIGFLTGIYLPVGELPEAVQTVIKCFPPSHGAALLRQVLMEQTMADTFAGAPAGVSEAFCEEMGVTYLLNGQRLSAGVSIAVLSGTAAVFFGLSVARLSGKRR